MNFDIYLPENGLNEAGKALSDMIKDLDLGVAYADMLRLRVLVGCSEMRLASIPNMMLKKYNVTLNKLSKGEKQ